MKVRGQASSDSAYGADALDGRRAAALRLVQRVVGVHRHAMRRELHGQRIRLVGVTASNFRDREQLALFGAAEDPKRHQAAEPKGV